MLPTQLSRFYFVIPNRNNQFILTSENIIIYKLNRFFFLKFTIQGMHFIFHQGLINSRLCKLAILT